VPAHPQAKAGRRLPAADLSYALLLGLAYVHALFLGFRLPSLWSINYYIPSAFDGFYRRSLAGTVLYPFGDLRFDYHFILAVQVAVFLAVNVAVLRAACRHPQYRWFLVVFLLSPAGPYLFHEIGYVDQLLFLLLLAALRVSHPVAAGALLAAAVLVHEMAVFFTVPLFVAKKLHAQVPAARIVWQVTPALGCFVTIYGFFQTVSREEIEVFMERLRQQADYRVRADYYDVFAHEFTGGRNRNYYGRPDLLNMLLLVPLLGFAAWLFAQRAHSRRDAWGLAAVGTGVATAPLWLGFFGWDTSRWIFLSACSAAFCIYVARDALDAPRLRMALATAGVFALFGALYHFDGYSTAERRERGIAAFLLRDLPREIGRVPRPRRRGSRASAA
jgi:hypothetical protein